MSKILGEDPMNRKTTLILAAEAAAIICLAFAWSNACDVVVNIPASIKWTIAGVACHIMAMAVMELRQVRERQSRYTTCGSCLRHAEVRCDSTQRTYYDVLGRAKECPDFEAKT